MDTVGEYIEGHCLAAVVSDANIDHKHLVRETRDGAGQFKLSTAVDGCRACKGAVASPGPLAWGYIPGFSGASRRNFKG